MKNINYVINGVLAVAVIILFVMQFSGKKESTVAPAFTAEGDSTNLLPVAYVNVDSLLSNYNYSKDLNERILKMQEDYRLDMTQRSNALRTELNDFQRKYEANAFLTAERAQQEGNRLQKKQGIDIKSKMGRGIRGYGHTQKNRRNFRIMRPRKNRSWLPSRWN